MNATTMDQDTHRKGITIAARQLTSLLESVGMAFQLGREIGDENTRFAIFLQNRILLAGNGQAFDELPRITEKDMVASLFVKLSVLHSTLRCFFDPEEWTEINEVRKFGFHPENARRQN